MNRSSGAKLVLIGFLGQFAIAGLNLLSNLFRLGIAGGSFFNIVSMLLSIVILIGFFFARKPKDLVSNLICIGYLVSLAIGILFPRFSGSLDIHALSVGLVAIKAFTVSSLLFGAISAAYLVLWAYKLMNKNILVSAMLGGAFLWRVILAGVLFNSLGGSFLFMLIDLLVTAIPVIAAYTDL